jgi:pimeloyl-ACP methyl ester carboxylesterase
VPLTAADAVVVASCLLLAALPSFVYIVIDKRSNSGRPRRVDSAALLSQMAPAARVVSSRRLVVHSASGLRVRLEYVLRGDPETQPVCMMVGGLGQQLIEWPEALIDPLLELGYCVLTYDNRDAGLSTTLDELQPQNEVINALKERVGLAIEPCYRLEDMAEDGMLLLDALSISRVDLVGQSMGGMIAQILLTTVRLDVNWTSTDASPVVRLRVSTSQDVLRDQPRCSRAG